MYSSYTKTSADLQNNYYTYKNITKKYILPMYLFKHMKLSRQMNDEMMRLYILSINEVVFVSEL